MAVGFCYNKGGYGQRLLYAVSAGSGMKLVTFEVSTPVGRFQRLGALLNANSSDGQAEHILDLNSAYRWLCADLGLTRIDERSMAILPPTMRGFIEAGEESWAIARDLVDRANNDWALSEALRFKGPNAEQLLFHRSNVKLLAPLPNPNSLRDFMIFEAHVKKGYERRGNPMPAEWYEFPVYYKGNHRTLIGPDEPVVWPKFTQKLDYELEWAAIIGKQAINVSGDDANNCIFGYTILNDWSARDVQMKEMICRLGPAKGKDFATSLGPYILTADELPDPYALTMQARVNGEVWSEGMTGTAHWKWHQMIERVSADETLYPGDILGSGTVGGGCGYELDRWIQPGDVVELSVTNLGLLRTPVISPEQAQRQALTSSTSLESR